jgi:hypothetical protein
MSRASRQVEDLDGWFLKGPKAVQIFASSHLILLSPPFRPCRWIVRSSIGSS